MTRLLEDRTAAIYGAGGAIGVPFWVFAREGAQAFLTGRRLAPLERVVTEIKRAGGTARTAQVDALDEAATERRLDQGLRNSAASISLSMRWASRRSRAYRSSTSPAMDGFPDGRVTAINQIPIQGKAATETVLTVRIQVH